MYNCITTSIMSVHHLWVCKFNQLTILPIYSTLLKSLLYHIQGHHDVLACISELMSHTFHEVIIYTIMLENTHGLSANMYMYNMHVWFIYARLVSITRMCLFLCMFGLYARLASPHNMYVYVYHIHYTHINVWFHLILQPTPYDIWYIGHQLPQPCICIGMTMHSFFLPLSLRQWQHIHIDTEAMHTTHAVKKYSPST